MNSNTLLRLLATGSFAATVLVNALANILPINGLDSGQVSSFYPSLFTPARLTFSIWSLIYLLLAGFVIFTWFRRKDAIFNRILPWFIMSCVFNMTWIIVWHYLLTALSLVIMLGLLVTLIVIFKTLHKHPFAKTHERIFVLLPFTLYLAWICVATIGNVSVLLVSIQWNGGLSNDTWTVIMMCAAALLAFKITLDFNVPFFSAVVTWALLGIHLRWRASEHTSIFYTSLMLITALAIVSIYTAQRKKPAQ